MAAVGVVEHLDVVEYLGACGVLGGIDPSPDPLAFEQAEEALHACVVVAVAAPTHAAHQAMGRQETLPVIAGVDRPLVRVNQATSVGFLRRHAADNKACTTNSVSARSRIAQPMTCLENRSITTARYIQPSCVRMKVKSLAQAVSGSVTSNCRSSRLAAALRGVPPWKRGLRP